MSEYSLKDDDRFTKQLKDLFYLLGPGTTKKLEDKIIGIRWALSTNPKAYRIVPEQSQLRVAATRRDGNIPRMQIWFVVDDKNKLVELRALDVDNSDMIM
jgi:hypothetical protein